MSMFAALDVDFGNADLWFVLAVVCAVILVAIAAAGRAFETMLLGLAVGFVAVGLLVL